jgi:hypothetical protein
MSDTTSKDLPTFAFSGRATIQHLNIRKEGPDDEKILAVDVKLSGKADGLRLCPFFDAGLFDFLFDEAGIARNVMLEPIGFSNVIEGAELQIAGIDFDGAKLSKFKVSPKDGGVVVLTFSAAISPEGSDVAIISEYVADDVDVVARMAPGLFDSPPSSGNAKAAAKKLDAMAREDGATGTLGDSSGETLITFGTDGDPMYAEALRVVTETRRASISSVQRHLRIGYNRAARLLETLERDGVVSAMGADGARKVLKSTEGATT